MSDLLRVMSCGYGVQSTTIIGLVEDGRLPMLDHVVFADTWRESTPTYGHIWWLTERMVNLGIKVHFGSKGDLGAEILENRGAEGHWTDIPFWTSDGLVKTGMGRRFCTRDYKVRVAENLIKRDVLGIPKGKRLPKEPVIEHWFGISMDEIERAGGRSTNWSIDCYPLIGLPHQHLDKPWRRWDCEQYLAKKYPGRHIPRSACVMCPLHDNESWRDLRDTDPENFEWACKFDEANRKSPGMRQETYLHRSCKPLRSADLGTDDGLPLFTLDCKGLCGT